MSRQPAITVIAAIAGLVLCTYAAQAQTVTGQVVDTVSGTPVGTGFVVLLDPDGREVARALSGSDGSFSLRAPEPGIYRIRSERIGYQAFTSEPFEIAAGEAIRRTLEVRAQAIVLAAVEVLGEDRCRTNPDEAEETGLVWQEIRKALAATAWDSTQELARYRAYGYRRSWDLRRKQVLSEEGTLAEGYARQPYRSVPLDRLLEEGFIVERDDSISYNLPDAEVLQDDGFLETHCFYVVRDSVERPGQIGLSFAPMSAYGLPDVRGALWLDEISSELRALEVSFTELPYNLVEDRAGGTIEFLMLPSGAWVIHSWQVRAPSIRVRPGGIREIGDRDQRIGIMGFNDTGGDVLEITTRDGEVIYPPGLAHLSGTVIDNSTARPVPGATISVEGTKFWGRTRRSGIYHFTAPIEGSYAVTLSHPWLDSIGVAPLRRDVELAVDDTVTVSFALPHADSIARRICAYDSSPNAVATVIGQVRTGSSGRPTSGREITASWQVLVPVGDTLIPGERRHTATTDRDGSYALCGLPVGAPVTIVAAGARPANIIFPRQVGGYLLFARDRVPGDPYTRTFRTRHRIWKVDLLSSGARELPHSLETTPVLSGYVSDDQTGRPLGGVTVKLNRGDSTVTRVDGTFDMVGVEWRRGSNTVSAERNGYRLWTKEIWLEGDQVRVELSVQLQR